MNSRLLVLSKLVRYQSISLAFAVTVFEANAQYNETAILSDAVLSLSDSRSSDDSEFFVIAKDEANLVGDSTVEEASHRSPDLDADSRGGSVSLQSRPFFTLKKTFSKGGFETRYNTLFDHLDPNGSFTLDRGFSKNRRLGGRITVNYEREVSGSNALAMDWQHLVFEGRPVTVLEDHKINTWQNNRIENGVSGTLDYKISDRFYVYLRGNWKDGESSVNHPRMRIQFKEGESAEVNDHDVSVTSGEVKRALEGFDEDVELATGGFFESEKLKFDYHVSYREDNYYEPDHFVLDQQRTRESADPATSHANASLLALHGMGAFHYGKLAVLTGLRLEKTNTDFVGNEVTSDQLRDRRLTSPVKGSSGYANLFPSIYVKNDHADRLRLMGSWTKTIDRPEFSFLVPFRHVDPEQEKLGEGNTDLKPTLFTKYDFSVDFKLTDKDLISFEFFYKEAENVIFSRGSSDTPGTYRGFSRTRNENGSDGSLWGIELTWDQSLDFFPFLPDGLNFNAIHTFTGSKFEYPDRLAQLLSIDKQPEHELELSLTYEVGRIYAQLRIKHESTTVRRMSEEPEEDRFEGLFTEVRLSTSYRLTERLRFVNEVCRFTDTPTYVRFEDRSHHIVNNRHGSWSTNFGVKFEL